ncbi:MAG TPA: cupredoxin domain-containing protein, partial [Thermoleophilaceae bacterium]|nr:cupredoxin domain-containing protein [Thermoleophilaceae bacterium]
MGISRWIVLVVVVSGLVVAGCGEDEETSQGGGQAETEQAETGQATEPSKPAAQTVKVSATDFAFDPANPRVKAGVVKFELTNDGQAPHALEVEAPGGEVETDVIEAGQSATVEADLSEGGSVTMYCRSAITARWAWRVRSVWPARRP